MKKLLLLLALIATVITPLSAQTSQLATLLHDGNLSVYYGATALKDAHEAAVAGDVITLSAGQFNACNLTKPLTIRGAGMGLTEVESFTPPTIITGDFNITVENVDEHFLILEGIQHNTKLGINVLDKGQFIKCVLGSVDLPGAVIGYYAENIKFINCDIRAGLYPYSKGSASIVGVNSHIVINYRNGISIAAQGLTANYSNCIIETNMNLYSSLFNNCIIFGKNNNIKLDNTCTSYYSVWYGEGLEQPFPFATDSDTNTRLSHTNVFKEGTFYELTDEIKALKTSNDSEVGIYGGSMPFNPSTLVPQISKFKVAPRTSADGKLSIDIEIDGINQ